MLTPSELFIILTTARKWKDTAHDWIYRLILNTPATPVRK